MAAVNLGPVERDALREIAYSDLRLLLDGNQVPGHRDLSKCGIPIPEQERVMLAEAIERVAAIADLSQLLDLIGWEPAGRAEGLDLIPAPAAVRALRYSRALIVEEDDDELAAELRLLDDVLGQMGEGAA